MSGNVSRILPQASLTLGAQLTVRSEDHVLKKRPIVDSTAPFFQKKLKTFSCKNVLTQIKPHLVLIRPFKGLRTESEDLSFRKKAHFSRKNLIFKKKLRKFTC